jgi:hypothetical protein
MTATKKTNLLSRSTRSTAFQKDDLGLVRLNLAEAMVGKSVDLFANHDVLHGVVRAALMLAGNPKLVVNGHMYDLNQVVTATPV